MRTVDYKALAGGLSLQLHCFDPATDPDHTTRTGVLFFHGGGWNGGTPAQFFPQCRELAQRGYLAMAAEYRIQSRHGTTPMDAVADARSCVRWVMAHAGELGLDPDRLILAGGSAGGHLALCSLITSAFDDPGDDSTIEPSAAGLVLFNPVADAGPEGYGYEQVKEVLNQISPLHAIKRALPPVLIMTGVQDSTTPITGIRAFRDKAVGLGGECTLIEYPGQTHGFFNYREGDNPCYRATTDEMLAFIQKRVPVGS